MGGEENSEGGAAGEAWRARGGGVVEFVRSCSCSCWCKGVLEIRDLTLKRLGLGEKEKESMVD